MDFSRNFEEIRKDRIGVVNSDVYPGLKKLVSQIYPDEAHFIYELLQNAEDAGATEVEFFIKKTKLIFSHNGSKLFDTDDIKAITNIASSTKSDNYVQAGKFGIGFKSVYAFTDTPSIYCDSINFKIEKLLLPTEIEPLKGKKEGWTEFHFPFNSRKISAEDAKKKIRQGLLEIEETTLLFLNNILSIKYRLEDGSENCVKKETEGNIVHSSTFVSGKLKSRKTWKRFSRTSTLHGKNISVDLAFPMERRKESGLDFVQGQDKVCISFLAKNEKSNLKFYVNAPFGCSPSRDSVNKEDKDNALLIEELAKLIRSSIEVLKQENMLTDSFFNILPIDEDNVPAFYQPIVNAIYGTFKDRSYLPTIEDGRYVTAGNGIMSSRGVINSAFFIDDIQYIYSNKKLQFVKNRPVTSRAYKFLKMLKIEELTSENVMSWMLNMTEVRLEKWLMGLNYKQLSEVYAFLYKGVAEIQQEIEKYCVYKDYDNEIFSIFKEKYESAQIYKKLKDKLNEIRNMRIVKGEDGKFYLPDETRILLKNIDIPDEYRLVDKKLINKQDSLSFLKAIGVKEFTEEELEEYINNQEKNVFLRKIDGISREDDPLEIARAVLNFVEKYGIAEVDLKSKRIVCTNRFSDADELDPLYASANECYLDCPYVDETGFRFAEDIHRKKGISEIYSELDEGELTSWIELIIQLGCYYSIEVKFQQYETEYKSGYHLDYIVPYLEQYLRKKNAALSRYVWRFFTREGVWKQNYSISKKRINQRKSEQKLNSSLLQCMKYSYWIMDKSGNFFRPEQISSDTIADDWEKVSDDNAFLKAIGFGAEQKREAEKLRIQNELEKQKQESQQDAAELLGFSDAEEVEQAKEAARLLDEIRKLGFDPDKYIESNNKEYEKKLTLDEQMQQLSQNDFVAEEIIDDGEVYRVANPERRREKIINEIADEKAPLRKMAVIKRPEANSAEKHFVGNEYSGRCQICNKIIFKRDGKRYFVAINLFDTGRLSEEYLQGLSTGWNTLCFCPNCAAEYKYGAVSMLDFFDKVKQTEIDKSYSDFYEFEIKLQGETRILRYTPRHLLSLKTALELYERNKDSEQAEENEDDGDNC